MNRVRHSDGRFAPWLRLGGILILLGAIIPSLLLSQTGSAAPPPALSPASVIPNVPRYQNYSPTNGLGTDAGEPSIGADWKTGRTVFQSYLDTLRVTFDDCSSPAKATWENKRAPTSVSSLDPILFTDSRTCRTFVSQLAGKVSLSSFTDDDGEHWTPSQGSGANSGVDHQTYGGGPFAAGPLQATGTYTHAIYYCSQDIADAYCSLSRDGGLTYGPSIPIYTAAECEGLHGHVKVAPNDGTVYVPNGNCGGTVVQRTNQAVTVSEDNGTTWQVRMVPDSHPGTDPSVGIGAGGTVYFGYQDGSYDAASNYTQSLARMAVSHDHGRTWSPSVDVGAALGIKNMVFPTVIAGDDDRAAFAFIGTPTAGDYQKYDATNPADPTKNFKGVWHLYISSTFDGGKTWTTVDATPTDPVQRDSICTGGTTCGQNRNLLDFMDTTVDKFGRVMVGYADGCIQSCVAGGPNSYSALATIARQSGGRRLFAANDPVEPALAGAPIVTATLTLNGARVSWQTPDNGGSAITGYNIYRGTASGAETLLTTVNGQTNTFDDTTILPGVTYFYYVTAVNAVGEGPHCNEVSPVVAVVKNPCTLPGVLIVTDPAGDQVGAPANQDLDIRSIHIAEPFFPDGSKKLVFTMQVTDLSTIQPNRQWKVIWNYGVGPRYYVSMNSDSTAQVSYDYGTLSDTGAVPTTSGPPDSGTYTPSGKITITIANSKIGNAVPGRDLTQLTGRTFNTASGSAALQSASIDYTNYGTYTVVGNESCRPSATQTAQATLTTTPDAAPSPTVQQRETGTSPSMTPSSSTTTMLPTSTTGIPSPTVTGTVMATGTGAPENTRTVEATRDGTPSATATLTTGTAMSTRTGEPEGTRTAEATRDRTSNATATATTGTAMPTRTGEPEGTRTAEATRDGTSIATSTASTTAVASASPTARETELNKQNRLLFLPLFNR
ncbi:MAG: hypothetical protein NVS2B7_26450 [Herpetosiphon sp.]